MQFLVIGEGDRDGVFYCVTADTPKEAAEKVVRLMNKQQEEDEEKERYSLHGKEGNFDIRWNPKYEGYYLSIVPWQENKDLRDEFGLWG